MESRSSSTTSQSHLSGRRRCETMKDVIAEGDSVQEGKWIGGNLVDFGMEFSNCFDNDFELIMIFD